MYEIENLNGIIRILSFVALLVMMGAFTITEKKVLRISSALFVVFLTSISIYITDGPLSALAAALLLLSLPLFAGFIVQIVSLSLLNKVEKDHGKSDIELRELRFHPFKSYKKFINLDKVL